MAYPSFLEGDRVEGNQLRAPPWAPTEDLTPARR